MKDLTNEEIARLFRALEWAGDDSDRCLVCRRYFQPYQPNNGHASDCMYAEVFYK